MQFLNEQSSTSIEQYEKLLAIVGSLSNLFSESNAPYVDSRISENVFCRAFNANNLGRSDISADASKGQIGVGIKTFLENNGRSFQKIAEFNRDRETFGKLKDAEMVFEVSKLRNARLETTKNITSIDKLAYHCVTRSAGLIKVFETTMNEVQIELISNINRRGNIISFNDTLEEYSFNVSKSVLMKRFITPANNLEIPVTVLDNPYKLLEKLYEEQLSVLEIDDTSEHIKEEMVVLPLYSAKTGKVEEKSGLNQWNAGGRKRSFDEVYIGIPAWLHKEFPGFFPPRDSPFDLVLPDGRILNAKLCQENSKALMSNPNAELGKWLLRDVLKLKAGEILTMEKLQLIGLDSVQLTKYSNEKFAIDFKETGSFEDFKVTVENVN